MALRILLAVMCLWASCASAQQSAKPLLYQDELERERTIDRMKVEQERRQKAQRETADRKEQERRREILVSTFTPEQKKSLLEKMPFVGADSETLLLLGPGQPDDVRTTVAAGGKAEFWHYSSRGLTIYLINGKVRSFTY